MERELIETRIEERDGATWISGVCPFCAERYAFIAPVETPSRVRCPSGHDLAIVTSHSAGAARKRPADDVEKNHEKSER